MADKFIKLAQLSHFYDKTKEVFVAKEAGKTLSTNDYTTAEKTKLAGIADGANRYALPTASVTTLGGVKGGGNVAISSTGVMFVDLSSYQKIAAADGKYYTKASATSDLAGKVDKVVGKALSTNDYTTADKNKLAGVEDGANNYILPMATTSTLGGIKVGANLSITSDGILSAVQGSIDTSPFETKANAANTYLSKASFNTEMTKYALKSDVATAVVNRGSVQTYADLPKTGQKNGDMYNVKTADATHDIKAGDNVVWDGTEWDNFGGIFAIDAATDTDIDGLF